VFQSMSRKANCLDNAAMESFFHLLKCEKIYHHDYKSFEDVAHAAADWISYYNNYRIKEKNGGKSPVQYRLLTTGQSA
ncbi:IS3 family transposase, partial [Neobacillus mesonae]|uniref:IS3 family transposase n=1 Tax=Neobacillus mesonae TaxID=1193713 RepID=UPI00203CDD09